MRSRTHVQKGPGRGRVSMALRTPGAGTRGGRCNRRKNGKTALPWGLVTKVAPRKCLQPPGLHASCQNSEIIGGLLILTSVDTTTTSASEPVSGCNNVCDIHRGLKCRSTATQAYCDTPKRNGLHSITLSCDEPTADRGDAKWSPHTAKVRIFIKCELVSLLTIWLTLHGFMTCTSTHLVAQASVTRPHGYAPPSSPPQKRYSLMPLSAINDSIFLFFNPPAISQIRVNTFQVVSFNFTVYTRKTHTGFFNNNNSSNTRTDITAKTFLPTKKTKTLPLNQPYVIAHTPTPPPPAAAGYKASNTNPDQLAPVNTSASPSHPATKSTLGSPPARSSTWVQTDTPARKRDPKRKSYWVMIYSDNDSVARPVSSSPSSPGAVYADAMGSYILMAVSAGRQHNFSIEARHVGRATISVAVVDFDGGQRISAQGSYVQAVAASQFSISAVRGERTADLVFNSAAATVAIIISFGIGAVTDVDSLKRQLKYPVPLIVGFCCQFVVMPLLAFCLAMVLPLDKELGFGLLCVACVPGGGFGHVAVIVADGDAGLSLTINLVSAVAMLGTAPLWIFVLGQYFLADPHSILSSDLIPIYSFEVWPVCGFLAYAAGLVNKRLRPAVADAILMWFIKPLLLLVSILYITLGVYINMYVFELVNGAALLSAMLLPLCGCVIAGGLAALCRQSYAFVKTIALETCSLNCLMMMVALRFSLKQPDADLAAVIPIWVMFTTPGLFVFLAICNKVKNTILRFWRNRSNKDSDIQSSSKAYSISSSIISPPGTTTMSAPLVTADGLEDDATISSSQKVTVL